MIATVPHPAKYSRVLMPALCAGLVGRRRILDPFGGVGGLATMRLLLEPGAHITINEIEPEWAAQAEAIADAVTVGDARFMPFHDGAFDAICTSPTYGNRMADHANWAEGRKHLTYKGHLGRALTDGNTGRLQWGEAYKALHREVWRECSRVLESGGILVLNISDHIRRGALVEVGEWHRRALIDAGFVPLTHEKIATRRATRGANRALRVDHESVYTFRKAVK